MAGLTTHPCTLAEIEPHVAAYDAAIEALARVTQRQ
jgi:hypothetical protein